MKNQRVFVIPTGTNSPDAKSEAEESKIILNKDSKENTSPTLYLLYRNKKSALRFLRFAPLSLRSE